jgi:hypothetical protein
MKRYQPSTPRALFASMAVALATFTIAMMVVLPSQVDWKRAAPGPLATHSGAQPMEVATRFVHVEVIAKRGRDVALTHEGPTKL